MSEKTNAVRLCDVKKVSYVLHNYKSDNGAIDGKSVAEKIGKSVDEVFKTLVTYGASKVNYVFVIPVSSELDLKKAAKAVREKFVEMIPAKDILMTTGYVKGGCSPIGMKKAFATVIDETLVLFEEITFSAGKIGLQISIKTAEIENVIDYQVADLI